MIQFDLSHRYSHEGRPSLLICDSKSFEINELKKFIDSTINSTSELLNLSKTRCEALLNFYSWDVPRLAKDYLNNAKTTLKNANLTIELIAQPVYDEGPWNVYDVDKNCSSSINSLNSSVNNSSNLNDINIEKFKQGNKLFGIDDVMINIDKDDDINENDDMNEDDNNNFSIKSTDNYKKIDYLDKDILISPVNVFSVKSSSPDLNSFVSIIYLYLQFIYMLIIYLIYNFILYRIWFVLYVMKKCINQ